MRSRRDRTALGISLIVAVLAAFLLAVSITVHGRWLGRHALTIAEYASAAATVIAAVVAIVTVLGIRSDRRTEVQVNLLLGLIDSLVNDPYNRGGAPSDRIRTYVALLPAGTLPTAEDWCQYPLDRETPSFKRFEKWNEGQSEPFPHGWAGWARQVILEEIRRAVAQRV